MDPSKDLERQERERRERELRRRQAQQQQAQQQQAQRGTRPSSSAPSGGEAFAEDNPYMSLTDVLPATQMQPKYRSLTAATPLGPATQAALQHNRGLGQRAGATMQLAPNIMASSNKAAAREPVKAQAGGTRAVPLPLSVGNYPLSQTSGFSALEFAPLVQHLVAAFDQSNVRYSYVPSRTSFRCMRTEDVLPITFEVRLFELNKRDQDTGFKIVVEFERLSQWGALEWRNVFLDVASHLSGVLELANADDLDVERKHIEHERNNPISFNTLAGAPQGPSAREKSANCEDLVRMARDAHTYESRTQATRLLASVANHDVQSAELLAANPKVQPMMAELLNDANPEVRHAAFQALANICEAWKPDGRVVEATTLSAIRSVLGQRNINPPASISDPEAREEFVLMAREIQCEAARALACIASARLMSTAQARELEPLMDFWSKVPDKRMAVPARSALAALRAL